MLLHPQNGNYTKSNLYLTAESENLVKCTKHTQNWTVDGGQML